MGRHGDRGAIGMGVLATVVAGLAGVSVGAVLVLTDVIDPLADTAPTTVIAADAPPSEVLVDCPGGEPVSRVYDDDRVFVVGIDESRSWAAVRRPDDVTRVGWVLVEQLAPDAGLEILPIRSCDGLNGALLTPTAIDPFATTTTTTSMPTTTETTDTTAPPPTTGSTAAPPTTETTATTEAITTEGTNTTLTPPADTDPPTLFDPLVLPDLVFPERCDGDVDTEATAYLTVEDETARVTASLSWRYLPEDQYDGDGAFEVVVDVGPTNTLLIATIDGLPDPYPPPISGPPTPVVVELEWVVTDQAGNTSRITDTFDLGRCL